MANHAARRFIIDTRKRPAVIGRGAVEVSRVLRLHSVDHTYGLRSGLISCARIATEALFPDEEQRIQATIMRNRRVARRNWVSTIL